MSTRVVERARTELERGRLWKARIRLEGALASRPTDQELLELLGEVSFAMHDLPAAGRYWFLTERDDADARAAEEALRERHPTPAALFTALPLKAPPDQFPPRVRDRLESLLEDPHADSIWAKKTRGFGRKGWNPRERVDDADGVIGAAIVVAVGLLTVGVWFVGLVALVYLVIRLV